MAKKKILTTSSAVSRIRQKQKLHKGQSTVTDIKSHLGFHIVSIAALALVAGFLIQALTPYGSATSPDSISYLDIGFNLRGGQGLVTTNLSFDDTGTNSYSPQRIWPPAYPALLSVLIKSPFDVERVRFLSGILLLISGILILMILRTGEVDWLVSLLIATLVLLTLPMVLVYTYVWSETLFIPILLGMVLVIFRYLRLGSDRVLRKSILIGLFVVLSLALVLTRYIGVAMILLFPLIYALSNRDRPDRIIIFSGLLTHAVLVTLFLADNYQVTGSISGGTRSPSSLSLEDNLQHMAEAFSTLFPTSLIGFGLGIVLSWAVLSGIVAARGSWAGDSQLGLRLKYVLILVSVATLYLGALVVMRTHSSFDQIDVRLIAPAVPIIVLGLAIFPALTASRVTFLSVGFVSLSLVFMLAIKGLDGVTNAKINWEKSGTPALPMRGEIRFNNFSAGSQGRGDAEFLRSLVAPEGYLFIERPLIWRFLTQRHTFSRPSTLTSEIIGRLNEMPEGSIIVVSPTQAQEMESMIEVIGLEMKTVNLGGLVGVRLPFSGKGHVLE